MFKRLLIANRGEIACRIIKTAQKMGITTLVIYSDADRHSLAVLQADEAYYVGESPAKKSYLNIDAILDIAQQTGADAIHPGYGFLSEQPDFAKAVTTHNIVFVGPPVAAMELMASKQSAKLWVEKHTRIPCIPGYHGDDQSDTTLLDAANRIGFPLLLKAAYGGGGKGLRHVDNAEQFASALAQARREAMSAFGDAKMILEKWLPNSRHIEIQVLADKHGHVRHLFERDCSIQRRHQKIIEEAGAPHLSDKLRNQLTESASEITQAIGYEGVGTLEFLVDADENYYFLEMNTRLQVEHPVTECITGLDLVELQLRVAYGEVIGIPQTDIIRRGHAIECRICAEDPAHDYRPVTGEVTHFSLPNEPHVRIDTGIAKGTVISPYYDSLLAKVITWGETRDSALALMRQALQACEIGGITTNLPFLKQLCDDPVFIEASANTQWLETWTYTPPSPTLGVLLAALVDYITLTTQSSYPSDWFGWQMYGGKRGWQQTYRVGEDSINLTLQPVTHNSVLIQDENKAYRAVQLQAEPRLIAEIEGVMYHAFLENTPSHSIVHLPFGIVRIDKITDKAASSEPITNGSLVAPIPAVIVACLKQPGDVVALGEPLILLEAMKMEHCIRAPHAGIVDRYCFAVGDQVKEGSQLVILKRDDTHE